MCVNIIKSVEQGIIDENLSNLNRVFALYSFYPSKKKCYFGGQMRDKMGDNRKRIRDAALYTFVYHYTFAAKSKSLII